MFASAPASSFRFAVVISILCLAAAAPAGARSDRTGSVHVGFAPQRVVQGSEAAVGVNVRPAGVRCALRVRYASGNYQPDLAPQNATGGRAVWPTRGWAGMRMPGCAPSRPVSQDPSRLVTLPCVFSSAVVSPKYQTFPALSCAYQSVVRSASRPRR